MCFKAWGSQHSAHSRVKVIIRFGAKEQLLTSALIKAETRPEHM